MRQYSGKRDAFIERRRRSSLVSEKKIFEISANQGILLALAAQGSRCRSPMSQFAIFFLDWRLKSASGDFLGA
jgi:hypothetical protein